MHQCRLEHGASGSIVGFGREGLWRRHSPAATRRGPVEKESNVLALSGFEGTFVFSFICHCARTRAGVALSRVGLSPASAAAMACGKEASAIWHVARWRWTLRTRADWTQACSERTSNLSRVRSSKVLKVRHFLPRCLIFKITEGTTAAAGVCLFKDNRRQNTAKSCNGKTKAPALTTVP